MLLLSAGAQARPSADPIIGAWSRTGSGAGSSNGKIDVRQAGAGFTGVVTEAYPSENGCIHRAGQAVWEIGPPSGGKYTGINHGFASTACDDQRQQTTWQVTSSTTMQVCVAGYGCATWTRPGTPTPTTTTSPTTTPKPPAGTRPLAFTWKVPERFGLDEDGNGLIDYATSRSDVDPSFWSLLVHIARCDLNTVYTFSIGRSLRAQQAEKGSCWYRVSGFPKLGTFTLKVSGLSAGGVRTSGTHTVVVRDWLVVGIGDSAGSGEGSPDIPGASDATWEFERCHRSAKSFEAQTAQRLEDVSDFSSVTFVHLACSGAGISEGATGEYFGIAPGGAKEPLVSQVAEARSLVGNRKVSALIMSIGVNDIGFGAVITFCAAFPDCMNRAYQGRQTLRSVIQRRLDNLRQNLYPQLAARLRPLVYAGRVYITEYFDPLRDDDGSLCTSVLAGIDEQEIAGLEGVLGKLNDVVREAAARFRWNDVGSAESLFREHGYCAGDNWIVTLRESLTTQAGSPEGTLHPNPTGYLKLAGKVFPAVYANVKKLAPLA